MRMAGYKKGMPTKHTNDANEEAVSAQSLVFFCVFNGR